MPLEQLTALKKLVLRCSKGGEEKGETERVSENRREKKRFAEALAVPLEQLTALQKLVLRCSKGGIEKGETERDSENRREKKRFAEYFPCPVLLQPPHLTLDGDF